MVVRATATRSRTSTQSSVAWPRDRRDWRRSARAAARRRGRCRAAVAQRRRARAAATRRRRSPRSPPSGRRPSRRAAARRRRGAACDDVRTAPAPASRVARGLASVIARTTAVSKRSCSSGSHMQSHRSRAPAELSYVNHAPVRARRVPAGAMRLLWRRLLRLRQLALGAQPILDVMAMLVATRDEQLVRTLRNLLARDCALSIDSASRSCARAKLSAPSWSPASSWISRSSSSSVLVAIVSPSRPPVESPLSRRFVYGAQEADRASYSRRNFGNAATSQAPVRPTACGWTSSKPATISSSTSSSCARRARRRRRRRARPA